jgi:hypothetical protein
VPAFLSLVKRAGVGVGLLTLTIGAVGAGTAAASQAASATINTFGKWDGSTYIQPFGCPDTTTYGQTITVPDYKSKITKFTFTWTDLSTGSFKVRGEVYAWDAQTQMATGKAVAQTKARTVSSGNSGFFTETFKVTNARVVPGRQYVIFASLDKNYSSCDSSTYEVGWGAIDDDSAYPDGTFVFQNNGEGAGGAANWTTQPWNSFGWDLAFKAYLK